MRAVVRVRPITEPTYMEPPDGWRLLATAVLTAAAALQHAAIVTALCTAAAALQHAPTECCCCTHRWAAASIT